MSKIFVTGASGHIGTALVPELIGAGHQVTALARSDEAAAKVTAAGAEVVRGSLDDIDLIAETAKGSDGIIHLAFRHDLVYNGDLPGATKLDNQLVARIGDALAGSGKPFVGVAGTLVLAFGVVVGRAGTEQDVAPSGPVADRENAIIALAEKGVRASVVRLAPVVHSDLDKTGFISVLIGQAKANGDSAYVGDGANQWPTVHTYDAARLLRLAFESGESGKRYHGAAEGGVPFKALAEAIGAKLGLATVSVAPERAAARFQFLAGFAQADNTVTADITRRELGWNPTCPGVVADIESGFYFA